MIQGKRGGEVLRGGEIGRWAQRAVSRMGRQSGYHKVDIGYPVPSRGGADTLLLYVVPRFVMYTASALESWANLRKET